MNAPRLRFAAASGLFLIWVAVLMGMVLVSSRPPRPADEPPADTSAADLPSSLRIGS
jgi:hypothetical protein